MLEWCHRHKKLTSELIRGCFNTDGCGSHPISKGLRCIGMDENTIVDLNEACRDVDKDMLELMRESKSLAFPAVPFFHQNRSLKPRHS